MTCQFIFKVGLPQWRSYTFFNECSLCTLYSSKEIPIAAILLNAAIYILRHCWFSNRQKEAAALKIKATASNARENMSALRRLFFFCCRSVELGSVHKRHYFFSSEESKLPKLVTPHRIKPTISSYLNQSSILAFDGLSSQ